MTLVAGGAAAPVRFSAKWRRITQLHGHNDARRESAAYAVQKLFLEPHDYVVPPSHGFCMPMQEYRERTSSGDAPVYDGTECVLGILSYWLGGARRLDRTGLLGPAAILDHRRFQEDESYRRSIANVNLLTTIMGNGDTHRGQFVIAGDLARWHVYAVDHTISLSHYRSLSLSDDEYLSIIQVPALPRSSIERLRAKTSADFDALSVIEQFKRVGGMLVPAQVKAPGGNLQHGLRWVDGELQLGLTQFEIDLLWNRTQDLLTQVDRGEISVF